MRKLSQEYRFYMDDEVDEDFWGDGGIDEDNDFNDDQLLSETSYVGPDYIDSEDVTHPFVDSGE